MSDEELIRDFVVRKGDLELILERLHENRGDSNQHLLVRGPRGMGKTTLVNRVIAEVRRDPVLRDAWYPLAFNEESYTVTSAAELWLQALVHLSEQTRDPALARLVRDLRREQDNARLRDRCLARLRDFADGQRKRLLVVVENLDMLFDDQLSDEDAWDIRHTLQNEPQIMLLATSVTRIEAFHDANKPLYELFWEQPLDPLEIDEIQAVWRMVTGEELPERRARPIQILTGGNTRLLVILASFARGRSFRELMTDLVALIDEHTPYFKDNIESLPREERKVFVTLADLWSPASSRQVSERARTDIRSTSALLGRLERRGAVTSVRQIEATRLYQVTERMYNLYYLLRQRDSERVRVLVRFMVAFYDLPSLVELIPGLACEACDTDGEIQDDIVRAYFQLLRHLPSLDGRSDLLARVPIGFDRIPAAAEELERFRRDHTQPPNADETQLRRRLAANPNDVDAWAELAALQAERGHPQEALTSLRNAWRLEPGRRDLVIGMVSTQRKFGDSESIVTLCDELLRDATGDALPLVHAGRAQFLALTRHTDAARREATETLERWPDDPLTVAVVGLSYEHLGDLDSAIEAHRQALEVDPRHIMSLRHLPRLLAARGRLKEAREALETGVDLHPTDEQLQVNLFHFLIQLGDLEGAREAIERAHVASPENAVLTLSLAHFYFITVQQPARATEVLRPLISDPSFPRARTLLTVSLLAQGHLDEAEALVARPDLPHDAATLVARAQVRNARGDLPGAIDLLRQALGLDPGSDTFALLLHTVVLAGDIDLARSEATRWIEAHPERAAVLLECVRIVRDLALIPLADDALAWADEALKLAPASHEGHFLKATLLTILSRWEALWPSLAALIAEPEVVQGHDQEITPLLLSVASMGQADGLLRVLEASPSAVLFEPLLVALRRMLGIPQDPPPQELSQVADDIIAKIGKLQELRSKKMRNPSHDAPALPASSPRRVSSPRQPAPAPRPRRKR